MFRSIDHFLPKPIFNELRYYAAEQASFADVTSPIDGVTYPLICEEIRTDIAAAVIQAMTGHLQMVPEVRHMFMRRSPAGIQAPNIHHTDNSMGTWSMMLYLDWIPEGGTAFVRNKLLGAAYAPELPGVVEMLQAAANEVEAWEVFDMCEAAPNRACIFDAAWFHRAEPVGGQGVGVEARTVLTVFYD